MVLIVTQTTTTVKKYGAPEVHVVGQTPLRTATVIFPYFNDSGVEIGRDVVDIPVSDFDSFYNDKWKDDGYLYSLIQPNSGIDGDVLNRGGRVV